MTVHEMKAAFVENELAALVGKLEDVSKLEYTVEQGGEEFVRVFDPNGRVVVKVCVTADSLSALTRDVLRAIE